MWRVIPVLITLIYAEAIGVAICLIFGIHYPRLHEYLGPLLWAIFAELILVGMVGFIISK